MESDDANAAMAVDAAAPSEVVSIGYLKYGEIVQWLVCRKRRSQQQMFELV